MTRGKFLVVEDNEIVGRSLEWLLKPYGGAVVARSSAEAMRHLRAARSWQGFLVDLMLPDGNGLDVLEAFRTAGAAAPALVVSGHLIDDEKALRRAYQLDASPIPKPFAAMDLARFLHEVAEHAMRRKHFERKVDARASAWRAEWKLSEGQTDILARAAKGQNKADIARDRDVSEYTVKTQISGLLKKTQYETLPEAVARLLRELAGG